MVSRALEQEAQKQGIVPFPTPELQKLLTALQQDMADVCDDLYSDVVKRPSEILQELAEWPPVANLIDFYSDATSVLNNLQRALLHRLHQVVRTWQENLSDVIEYAKEGETQDQYL